MTLSSSRRRARLNALRATVFSWGDHFHSRIGATAGLCALIMLSSPARHFSSGWLGSAPDGRVAGDSAECSVNECIGDLAFARQISGPPMMAIKVLGVRCDG